MNPPFSMGPQVVRCTDVFAEVFVPFGQIWVEYRCPRALDASPSHLTMTWCGHKSHIMEKPIRLSPGTELATRKVAAAAIAQKRAGPSTRRSADQLSFKF